MKYRSDIDGLRAIAVLSVVIFHAFPALFAGGFVGVDVFFVISGYLISSLIFHELNDGTFSFLDFYSRRVRRIFPALIILILVCFCLGWIFFLPKDFVRLGKHMIGGATFSSNFILTTEFGYFEPRSSLKPLLHLWSLAVEEQFYITYPLLLVLARKVKLNSLWVLAAVGGVSFILNIMYCASDDNFAYYFPQFRFWELALGGMLAYYHTSTTKRFAENQNLLSYLSIIAIFSILASALFIDNSMSLPGWWMLIPTLGAVALIAFGPHGSVQKYFLSHPAMVYIGLISYPVYLWHWSLLSFVEIVFGEDSPDNIRLYAIALSFALASLTYHFVEKPIRRKRHSLRIPAIIVVVLAAIGFLGWKAMDSGGFPERLPKLFAEMDQYTKKGNEPSQIVGRRGTCWLTEGEYAEECIEKGSGPLVVLWGDSQAGYLTIGMMEIQKKYKFRFGQFNRNSCPPLFNYAKADCVASNQYVLKKLKEEKPATIVLYARWNILEKFEEPLTATIAELKKIGIKKIIVLGPPPQWYHGGLPHSLFHFYRRTFYQEPPKRMTFGLDAGYEVFDQAMSDKAKILGVRYLSVRDILCNSEGCLTYLSKFPETLTSWDYGHLSVPAAELVANSIPLGD